MGEAKSNRAAKNTASQSDPPLPGRRSRDKMALKMALFLVKGVWILNFVFLTPKRRILAQKHVSWRIVCQHQCGHLGCRPTWNKTTKLESWRPSAVIWCTRRCICPISVANAFRTGVPRKKSHWRRPQGTNARMEVSVSAVGRYHICDE